MTRLIRLPNSLTVVLVFAACATPPPPKPVAKVEPTPEVAPPPSVEKLREYLEVTPLELFFSGLRGKAQVTESVSLKNTGPKPMQIDKLQVVGEKAEMFRVTGAPGMPSVLGPGMSMTFQVLFAPPANAEQGVTRARVRVLRPLDDDGPPVDLSALVTKGGPATDEPSLHQILEALGYAVNVGSNSRILPPSPAGDEVKSPRLERAKEGNVGMYLIARYTSDEDSSFGTYSLANDKPVLRPVGGAAKGNHQTLNPELAADSQTSFESDGTAFGLFLKVGKRILYSNPARNGGKAAAKVFPLSSRGRTVVPDALVVAFDEDGDGDFQDHVFMLWNVKAAQ